MSVTVGEHVNFSAVVLTAAGDTTKNATSPIGLDSAFVNVFLH